MSKANYIPCSWAGRVWLLVWSLMMLWMGWQACAAESTNSWSEWPSGKGPKRAALIFRNGDLLYGALDSVEPGSGLRWRHAETDPVLEFKPESIQEIRLPQHTLPETIQLNLCRLFLRNGDEIEGELVSVNHEKAVLHTWYAGAVTVPRQALRALIPVPPEGEVVFRGPSGLEGWTIGKVVSPLGNAGAWQYRNGAFYATNAASIARDVKLPDVAKVDFDMAWRGLFQLALALYTDYFQPINLANKDTEPDFGGFYSLQLNSFSANLLPVKKNDPLRFLGQVSVPTFNQKTSAHVEILVSKPKRSITLLVDGQLIKQWVESEEFVGEGTGVRFVHQGQGRVRISHFQVAHWDGQFEESPSSTPPTSLDLTKLRNGDKVSGATETIVNGTVTVRTGEAPLQIPLARIKQVEFADSKATPPELSLGAVRAFFARGGAVTFQLEKWEAGKVLGFSPNFGRLAFDPGAFSSVELNLKAAHP